MFPVAELAISEGRGFIIVVVCTALLQDELCLRPTLLLCRLYCLPVYIFGVYDVDFQIMLLTNSGLFCDMLVSTTYTTPCLHIVRCSVCV